MLSEQIKELEQSLVMFHGDQRLCLWKLKFPRIFEQQPNESLDTLLPVISPVLKDKSISTEKLLTSVFDLYSLFEESKTNLLNHLFRYLYHSKRFIRYGVYWIGWARLFARVGNLEDAGRICTKGLTFGDMDDPQIIREAQKALAAQRMIEYQRHVPESGQGGTEDLLMVLYLSFEKLNARLLSIECERLTSIESQVNATNENVREKFTRTSELLEKVGENVAQISKDVELRTDLIEERLASIESLVNASSKDFINYAAKTTNLLQCVHEKLSVTEKTDVSIVTQRKPANGSPISNLIEFSPRAEESLAILFENSGIVAGQSFGQDENAKSNVQQVSELSLFSNSEDSLASVLNDNTGIVANRSPRDDSNVKVESKAHDPSGSATDGNAVTPGSKKYPFPSSWLEESFDPYREADKCLESSPYFRAKFSLKSVGKPLKSLVPRHELEKFLEETPPKLKIRTRSVPCLDVVSGNLKHDENQAEKLHLHNELEAIVEKPSRDVESLSLDSPKASWNKSFVQNTNDCLDESVRELVSGMEYTKSPAKFEVSHALGTEYTVIETNAPKVDQPREDDDAADQENNVFARKIMRDSLGPRQSAHMSSNVLGNSSRENSAAKTPMSRMRSSILKEVSILSPIEDEGSFQSAGSHSLSYSSENTASDLYP